MRYLSSLLVGGALLRPCLVAAQTNSTTIEIQDHLGYRTVSYFINNGLAVIDGDIIYGTEAELLAVQYNGTANSNCGPYGNGTVKRDIAKRSLSVFPESTWKWPGGVVPYQYESSTIESNFKNRINDAIADWIAVVPCLQFKLISGYTGNSRPPNTVVIRAGTRPDVCSASWVGFRAGASMDMQLVPGCDKANIIHEFGHILGLYHEHKRWDRMKTVAFHCENLKEWPYAATQLQDPNDPTSPPKQLPPQYQPGRRGDGTYGGEDCCGDNYPGVCCGDACQFSTLHRGYAWADQEPHGFGTDYEVESIMHYTADAFAKSGTMTLQPGKTLRTLSAGDAARVRALYGCPTDPKPACPKSCNPIVGRNTCHIPSAQNCIYPNPAASSVSYCACAPGYKGTGYGDNDIAHHWRLPIVGHEHRVWVAEGVECSTLCTTSSGIDSCKEVKMLDAGCL